MAIIRLVVPLWRSILKNNVPSGEKQNPSSCEKLTFEKRNFFINEKHEILDYDGIVYPINKITLNNL